MSGTTLYCNNGVAVKFKPTSQLYPYVRLEVTDDDDTPVVGVDFDGEGIKELEQLGQAILRGARMLKAAIAPPSPELTSKDVAIMHLKQGLKVAVCDTHTRSDGGKHIPDLCARCASVRALRALEELP